MSLICTIGNSYACYFESEYRTSDEARLGRLQKVRLVMMEDGGCCWNGREQHSRMRMLTTHQTKIPSLHVTINSSFEWKLESRKLTKMVYYKECKAKKNRKKRKKPYKEI